MAETPPPVAEFLAGARIAIAGVSRSGDVAANSIFKRLVQIGYHVFPVNPNADEVEGVQCYPDVGSVPQPLDGVVIATHPRASADVVRQCIDAGVTRVWLHRSFGGGSVSEEALRLCGEHGIACIEGGCPLMFAEPVDIAHRCMRWWLQRRGRVPR
jgi:predicted CoA-binding protein